MPMLEIIGVPQSNFVWACRIAAEESQAPYELVPALPHSPEVAAIHPLGRIPVMRHGAVRLFEARAICGYIDASFPGAGLAPVAVAERAAMEQWISAIITGFHPDAMRPYIFAHLFPGTPDGRPNQIAIAAALPKLTIALEALDRAVGAGALGTGGFLAGGSFSLADVFLLPLLHYLAAMPESAALIDGLAGLRAYHARHRSRPSIVRTVPPPFPK